MISRAFITTLKVIPFLVSREPGISWGSHYPQMSSTYVRLSITIHHWLYCTQTTSDAHRPDRICSDDWIFG